MGLTVLLRGYMADFLKRLGKIAAGGKAGAAGDLFDAVACSCQKILGSRNPHLRQVCDRRFSVKLCKLVAQIIFCNVAAVSQRVKRDLVVVIFLNVASGLVALTAAV